MLLPLTYFKKYQFQNIEPILTLSILNIFNKQHESSKGYPEPGEL